MSDNKFSTLTVNVEANEKLREPQVEAYSKVKEYFGDESNTGREVGIVLPVGCGKSGLIAIAPFAIRAKKVLVVAPGTHIAGQLLDDFDPTNDDMFYRKCSVLTGPEYPEPAEIRGKDTNRTDIDAADVVVTNIQQLQGPENRWLSNLATDYFDLILFDEGHHNVAESWEILRQKFPNAKIINVSATPARADGKLMSGEIIYTYPIYKAVQKGFVKHLRGIVLNPRTLQYIERKNGKNITVDLEEVKRLAKTDAIFRRSIVSSPETLNTIVDASIRELKRMREETDERKLKIIASALNMDHCKQIVSAYSERGLKAEYIHSKEDSKANERVKKKLKDHEIDVIVQVRMLGEGFDHKYLSVAAVFSIFANLSPFVQFVGRVMRVIEQNKPGAPLNMGTVIFHAGANTASAWGDFREFAEADQDWFKLLTEQVPLEDEEAIAIDPESKARTPFDLKKSEVKSQGIVTLEVVPLLSDKRVLDAIELLKSHGVNSGDDFQKVIEELRPVPVTKQGRRRATKKKIDEIIKTRASRMLAERGINNEGHDLDLNHLGRTNWLVVKTTIDRFANAFVGRSPKERHEFSQEELDKIEDNLNSIIEQVAKEVFSGETKVSS